MSTALVSATRRILPLGVLLVSWTVTAACGGQSVQDEGTSGGASSGGAPTDGVGGSPSSGGDAQTGGAPAGSGGEPETGGASATGGQAGADNGCNTDTIECPDGQPGCSCTGVFEDCPWNNIRCEADEERQPRNCTCGEPDVLPDDCDYRIQFRCEPYGDPTVLTDACSCDPVLPTDEEPCRYFQEMYDEADLDRTCTMLTNSIEPEEKYKYSCECT